MTARQRAVPDEARQQDPSPVTPLDPPGETAVTPAVGPGTEDSRDAHSGRQRKLSLMRALRERNL